LDKEKEKKEKAKKKSSRIMKDVQKVAPSGAMT
jgi:hypothetical protein